MDKSTRRGRRVGVALLASAAAVALSKQGGRAQGYRKSLPWRIFDRTMQRLDQSIGWDRLPLPLSLAALVGIRNILRKRNLHDTTGTPSEHGG